MNTERVTEILRRQGFAALVSTSPIHTRYLLGFESQQGIFSSTLKAAVISVDGRIRRLVCAPAEAGFIVDRGVEHEVEILTYGSHGALIDPALEVPASDGRARDLMLAPSSAGAWEAVGRALEGLPAGPLLADSRSTPELVERLRGLAPARAVHPGGQEAVELARMVKSPTEIALLRRAAELNATSIADALASLGSASEETVGRRYRSNVAIAGGMVQHWMGIGGRRSGLSRPPVDLVNPQGERFRFDGGMELDGYCGDTGGTVQVGEEPSHAEARVYRALTRGLVAALEMVRPGTRPSQLYERLVETVRTEGVPEFAFPLVGHGIGVEQRDLPFVSRRPAPPMDFAPNPFDPPLETGMVINLETPWNIVGVGSYQHEVTVAVTSSGFEFLSPLRDYEVVGRSR